MNTPDPEQKVRGIYIIAGETIDTTGFTDAQFALLDEAVRASELKQQGNRRQRRAKGRR